MTIMVSERDRKAMESSMEHMDAQNPHIILVEPDPLPDQGAEDRDDRDRDSSGKSTYKTEQLFVVH